MVIDMKLKLLILFFFFFLTALYSQQSYDHGKFLVLEKLSGEWRSEKNSSITVESWDKITEKTFEGYGKFINTTDGTEIITETLRLVEMGGEIFYIAKVSHNKLPVPFKLTESNDSTLIFENKDHDFPKKIKYLFSGKDEMIVTVGEGEKSFIISFNRVIE